MDLIEMSLSASVLIVVTLLIRAVGLYRLPKKTFAALWMVALLRLLLPVSIPFAFGFYSGLDALAAKIVPDISTQRLSGKVIAGETAAVFQPVGEIGKSGGNIPAVPMEKVIWMIGAALLAVIFAAAYLRCLIRFRQAKPAELKNAGQWLKRYPLRRRVRILQSGAVLSPLTYGVWNPVILLPERVQWEDERQLEYILLHEQTHIRQFDALVKLVLAAAVCLHWFNPLVWVMYFLMNRDLELCCDEAVIRVYGESARASYALSLIQMEEKRSRAPFPCVHFSKNVMEERIVAIMKTRKTSIYTGAAAFMLVACVAVGFATSSVKAENYLGTTEPSTPSALRENLPEREEKTAEENGVWQWPSASCFTISSGYGDHTLGNGEVYFCDHICITGANAKGDEIRAARKGTVSETGYDFERGYYVKLVHEGGFETEYRHLLESAVENGDQLEAGEKLGVLGQTGCVTGPCLAFAVYQNGQPQDPLDYYQPMEPSAETDLLLRELLSLEQDRKAAADYEAKLQGLVEEKLINGQDPGIAEIADGQGAGSFE